MASYCLSWRGIALSFLHLEPVPHSRESLRVLRIDSGHAHLTEIKDLFTALLCSFEPGLSLVGPCESLFPHLCSVAHTIRGEAVIIASVECEHFVISGSAAICLFFHTVETEAGLVRHLCPRSLSPVVLQNLPWPGRTVTSRT